MTRTSLMLAAWLAPQLLPAGGATAATAPAAGGDRASRPFAVHWNIVGPTAPQVASLLTPAVNACLTYDVRIFGENFGKFLVPHVGKGFAAVCASFPCGLAGMTSR